MATTKKTAPATKAPAKKSAAPAPTHQGVDWRTLYLYAVCLVTLLVVLFSTVAMINAIFDAIFPNPAYIDPYLKAENAPSPELLQQQEDNNQRQAIKNIFTTFTTMAISTPVYLYHWRQARKASN